MHKIQAYIGLALMFISIIFILYLPILIVLKRKKNISVLRQMAWLGLFCSLFLIIFATILYMGIHFTPEVHNINMNPFKWLKKGNIGMPKRLITQLIPNIIMFIPLGIFIPLVFKSKRKVYKVLLLIILTTISIETFQCFIGRLCDIDDVIANTIGGLIGYMIFYLSNLIFKNKVWWNKLLG